MQTQNLKTALRVSALSSTINCANRRAEWDLTLIRDSLNLENLRFLLCRWCDAFRSFRAHIRIQSARMGGSVDAGPAFQLLNEHLELNARTSARVEGIKTLQAKCPWVDTVDLRIFLMGFDEGERYNTPSKGRQNQHTPGTQTNPPE